MAPRWCVAIMRYIKSVIWGFLEGLFPWAAVSVFVSIVVKTSGIEINIEGHEVVASSISSVLGLLNAFLVTTNISIAGKINEQVRELQGACTECALLHRSIFSQNTPQIIPASNMIINVLSAASNTTGDEQITRNIKETIGQLIPTSNLVDIAPPTAVAVVKSINNVSSQYGKLVTLRAARTPPAIETLVYTLGVFNLIMVTSSIHNVTLDVSVLMSIFVVSSSLGLLGISNVVKDPLDRSWLSSSIVEDVSKTIKEINDIMIGQQSFSASTKRLSAHWSLNFPYYSVPQNGFSTGVCLQSHK